MAIQWSATDNRRLVALGSLLIMAHFGSRNKLLSKTIRRERSERGHVLRASLFCDHYMVVGKQWLVVLNLKLMKITFFCQRKSETKKRKR